MALGDLHRAGGDLSAAHALYAEAASAAPSAKAAWLHAMLAGRSLPHGRPCDGYWPVPFVRLEAFLCQADHQRMLAAALSAGPWLVPAKVRQGGHATVEVDQRSGFEVAPWRAREARTLLTPRVAAWLPEVRRRLRMDRAEVAEAATVGPQLCVYSNGGFGAAHFDGEGDVGREQSLTAIYYLHSSPKPFAGGDLLLYDTAVADGKPIGSRVRFSRLEPASNSLVFFPSGYWHAIAPVSSPTTTLRASRIAVVYYFMDLGDKQ